MKTSRNIAKTLIAIGVSVAVNAAAGAAEYGINLSGAEHDQNGKGPIPGTYVTDYHYPTEEYIVSARAMGFKNVRIPFRQERVQHHEYEELYVVELNRLLDTVALALDNDLGVTLDNHTHARFNGEVITASSLADFWGRLSAAVVARFGHAADSIWYGLSNEPYVPEGADADVFAAEWMASADAAIGAIRSHDANRYIVVSGTRHSNAHRHSEGAFSNEDIFEQLSAQYDNLISEVHSYGNDGYTGWSAGCQSPTIFKDSISGWAQWLSAKGFTGYIGEWGFDATSNCLAAAEDMITYLRGRPEVLRVDYWVSGHRYPADQLYVIDPSQNAGMEMLEVLQEHAFADSTPPDNHGMPEVEVVFTSDNGSGFAIYDGVERSWVSAACITKIVNAGFDIPARAWSDVAPLPDRDNPLDCDDLIAATSGEDDQDPPPQPGSPAVEVIALAYSDSHFALYNGATRSWVSPECVSSLQSAGIAVGARSWNEISDLPDHDNPYDCVQLHAALSEQGSGWRLLATGTNRDGFLLTPDNTRQWVSESCVGQLAAAGATLEIVPWSQIADIADTPGAEHLDCAAAATKF